MAGEITPQEFQHADGVADWRVVGDGACAFFRIRSLADASRFVHAIADIPAVDEHPPAIDVRHDGVTVRLVTSNEDHFGMTTRDVEIARLVSDAARAVGLASDPSAIQSFLVIPGAPSIAEIMPFWRAVLGYEPRPDSPDEDLVDPRDRGPALWLEQMDEPHADDGGAIHVAVWIPYEEAEARVAAALAAGGRMVRDDFAPAWWTLADAAGNEADIATIEHRD